MWRGVIMVALVVFSHLSTKRDRAKKLKAQMVRREAYFALPLRTRIIQDLHRLRADEAISPVPCARSSTFYHDCDELVVFKDVEMPSRVNYHKWL